MEQKMCPVDVISVCNTSGELRPLRLRLEDESRQLLRINIEEILRVDEIQHVGAEAQIFLCKATVWDRRWVFELKYVIRTHTWWMLGKINR